MIRVLFLTALLGAWFSLLNATNADEPQTIDFNTQIRPILSDKCFFCHGPDAENRKADLRLDLEEAAKSYAIIAGSPDDSEVLTRVSSDDPEIKMPPPHAKISLTPTEIKTLRDWIAQGAPWSEHWAFVPPKKAELPTVKQTDWATGPIDRFVLARLEKAGLEPSEAATRETSIRRVTFDLTGLPPTLEEIDRFLADKSPDAYETVVDRLLKSERFGEHMTASWLDVARYSDTYGYQQDRDRYVWPWRDWVIRAFNENMPYDQFLTEQLAGDLLPDATRDQILATTFNRLHPQKVEGGSVPEEFRIEYVADRLQTVGTAFLGLTFECARCHDHKYDPLAQKEYYQLSAFFDNIDEAGLYSFFTSSVPTPTLLLTDENTQAKLDQLDRQIAEAEANLNQIRREAKALDLETLRAKLSEDASDPATQISGQIAHLDFEGSVKAPNESVPGRVGKAARLTGDDGIGVGVGNFRRSQPFSVSLWMKTPDVKERAVIYHRSRAWTDAASRGYQLLIEDGRLSASLIHFWPGNAIRVRTKHRVPTERWVQVTVTYDGSSRADGLRIHIDGRTADHVVVRDNLSKNITGGGGDTITIGQRFRDRGFTDGEVDEFRVFDRELTALEVLHLHNGETLDRLRDSDQKDLTPSELSALRDHVLAVADQKSREARKTLETLRDQRNKIADRITEIMVMRETAEPRQTYLLNRGAYDARGEKVIPETPTVLPPFPTDQPRNRLGLARWLTATDHPLTARVAVNRFWQLLFGQGLVRTPEDFGSQGTPPTHPQLLDWLARDFIETDWDVKRLLKQIVMSSTYRQSSVAPPKLRELDPENRLLARAPSYRLSAEMLRDNALAVSGRLTPTVGGSPVRPYEVEASFKPVRRHNGDRLYRRSLYTYWKRSAPAPAMMTLDASKRDVCRMKRERTSSPLQALVLLNGPQYVEAARGLAERLLKEHGAKTDAVIVDLFRTLTSREPNAAETEVLTELYRKQLTYFGGKPERAKNYLSIGEASPDSNLDAPRLAAVSVLANTLMNFDESVMKR